MVNGILSLNLFLYISASGIISQFASPRLVATPYLNISTMAVPVAVLQQRSYRAHVRSVTVIHSVLIRGASCDWPSTQFAENTSSATSPDSTVLFLLVFPQEVQVIRSEEAEPVKHCEEKQAESRGRTGEIWGEDERQKKGDKTQNYGGSLGKMRRMGNKIWGDM